MQKIFVSIVCMAMVLATSSCITSLQPVATAATVITDNRLPGKWKNDQYTFNIEPLSVSQFADSESPGKVHLSFGELGGDSAVYAKSYVLTMGKGNSKYAMVGFLSKIGDQYFMDIMSLGLTDLKGGNDNGSGYEFTYDYLPAFSIARVEFVNKNKITIKYLNGDFVRKQIDAGNLRLKHEEDKLFNTFLITASSFELRQFLEKYGHDERFYNDKDAVTFTKVQ